MNKVFFALKWSSITEITSKLITPITNMVLARLLAPEMFGVVATLTMVISLADVFSDAGFQKYLIYKEFESKDDLHKSANVAFITNITVSLILWLGVSLFSKQVVGLVGSEGLEKELIIICCSLPLTAFSSIQIALYRRSFDFKTLFLVRIIGMCIPLIVTVPLAFLFENYWALIIGTISTNLVNAVVLTAKSKWRPSLYFDFFKLKQMLSFSLWTLIERILTWFTSYCDVFIVGRVLSSYWLGIYKISMTTTDNIMNIIVASITPVMFSTLSRLQEDGDLFEKTFLSFQQKVSIIVIPMGIGIYLYRDLITYILLGNDWLIASDFVGVWGLAGAFTIVLGKFCGEAFRSKGKPWLSCFVQSLSLLCIVITVCFFVNRSFSELIISRSAIRLIVTMLNVIVLQIFLKISVSKMINSIFLPFVSGCFMAIVSFLLQFVSDNVIWQLFSILVCIIIYFMFLFIFPSMRKIIVEIPLLKKVVDRFKLSKR